MKQALLLISLTLTLGFARANETDDSLQMALNYLKWIDSVENTLNYKTGKITLGDGIATINVSNKFKFLEPAEAKFIIEDIWGNPPSGFAPLGLLIPSNTKATDAGSYAFVVSFEDLGYVKDHDADKIDYDDLLKEIKQNSDADNVERRSMDLFTMDLIGWASKPFYDKEKKILHWAKEFSIPEQEINTLNYDIRVLGRKGVLVLQAVSGMDQLDSVKNHIDDVLSMVSFNEGHRYADFDSKTDDVAAWTIGGLVAGKVLAKVGFFAVILKFGKFILIGLALAGGAIWRFITGRRKKEEEFVYVPQQANNDTDVPKE